jgi:hypothetical protein
MIDKLLKHRGSWLFLVAAGPALCAFQPLYCFLIESEKLWRDSDQKAVFFPELLKLI